MRLLWIACVVAGCGQAQHGVTNVHRNERITDPNVVDRPTNYQCGDSVLNDQSRTGGLPTDLMYQPCWHLDDEPTQQLARAERVAANDEERVRLAAVDKTACSDISVRERTHSPFVHKQSIARIIPHRIAGELAGVRIVFKPVPALTKAWLEQDLACQKARWVALGQPVTNDPTLVRDADVQVFDRGSHLEVLVETQTPDDAQVAFERARGTLQPVAGSQAARR